MIYSADLKAKDPKIKPIFDNIPIVKLGPNQKIRMEMVARIGRAKEHSKFQGALASYSQTKADTFDFFVESYNNIEPKEFVSLSLDILLLAIGDLREAIKKPEADEKQKKTTAKAKKEAKKKVKKAE